MNTPASDFAERGADLLRLVAALARATRGRFDGEAASILETANVFAEAAMNSFAALANTSGLTAEQRLRVSVLSTKFRDALGNMATYFPPGSTVRSFSDLGKYDPKNPNEDRLGVLMDPGADPLVTVSAPAQEALTALRRDPLALTFLGRETLLKAMGAVADGMTVAAA